jgi:hypothetical protein
MMRLDTYDAESTAPLVIDPYNDFISEGGIGRATRDQDRWC